MTQKLIEQINNECPYNQGIFVQPYGVPTHIKEAVIYNRYETGGYSGGSCWDDEENHARSYSEDEPTDSRRVLDIVLKHVFPNISHIQFQEVERLWIDNYDTEYEYYGNSTDYHIDYILLSTFEALIEKLRKQ